MKISLLLSLLVVTLVLDEVTGAHLFSGSQGHMKGQKRGKTGGKMCGRKVMGKLVSKSPSTTVGGKNALLKNQISNTGYKTFSILFGGEFRYPE